MLKFALGFVLAASLVTAWLVGDWIADEIVRGYLANIFTTGLCFAGFLLGTAVQS